MKTLLPLILFLAIPRSAAAQQATPSVEDKGPYLGILFSPVPEALFDHLPQLSREFGVLVTHVLPDSPASTAAIKKHDILLSYDGEKVRDGSHLVRLIRAGKPGQVVRLNLLRGGRETTLDAKLTLGPMLKVARGDGKAPPGIAKPGGPPAVSVTAVPMEGNRLHVTFEFSELGRIRKVRCAGNAEEIDREIERLPTKVQTVARAAVLEIRKLGLQK